MGLLINENKLNFKDINEFESKIRALLIDDNNNILIARYGSVYLFPGGKVEGKEMLRTSISRELLEETGIIYEDEELSYFNRLLYYQPDYPKRNGDVINRLITTYYYIGHFKGIDFDNQHLSDGEKKDGFVLQLVSLDEIEELIINNISDNPRNVYFEKEALEIIKSLKTYLEKQNSNIKEEKRLIRKLKPNK